MENIHAVSQIKLLKKERHKIEILKLSLIYSEEI